ncbi:MAG: thiamine pyrophosphate-dependent enzyme, partial [Bdellovibrionales bacterium]|nr:thiamine pyrophosphate-dependent enzyme [Bdellovibrionales bacterium]
ASHFGGPAAFAEMMSATHGYMFLQAQKQSKTWHEMFHFINDAGHCENGIYALKANYGVAGLSLDSLKGFRSIESQLTGHGEAHLFPESVYIINGPLGSGLPQAQGLGAAESMSDNPRLTITAISDGACMEGEAKEAFAAIPGLASKGKMGPMLCMISDNNTKLSGRIDEDSFSMRPTFNSLEAVGWQVTYVDNGHDLEKVYQAIEDSAEKAKKQPQTPQLLWIKTIKGKGVEKTEQSASGGHGFPLKKAAELSAFVKEIYGSEEVPSEMSSWISEIESYEKPKSPFDALPGDRGKIQVGVANALKQKFSEGLPVVSVSADLQGSTGVAGFRKEYPEAAFEVGVAESNMVSMAVGMSKQGYIPVVDTFAQFGVTKGALPLIMSGLSQAPIIGIYSHTGFQDAADGASHQAISYLSMVSSIPNVDVISLTCSDEAFELVGQAIDKFAADRKAGKIPRSVIFFLGRETFLSSYSDNAKYEYGKAQVVSDNTSEFDNSVTLMGVGSLLENTLLAQKKLAEQGVGSVVVNPSMMNWIDSDTVKSALAKTGGKVVTVEDHRVLCGFGSMLAHDLSLKGVDFKMKSLGIEDHFGRSAYMSAQLYESNGLGVNAIADAAKSL